MDNNSAILNFILDVKFGRNAAMLSSISGHVNIIKSTWPKFCVSIAN